MEIMYGARRTGMNYRDYIGDAARRAASARIPGTAAEILDDEVREILSPQEGRRPRPGSRSSPPRTALGMPHARRPSCTATSRRPATSRGTSSSCGRIQKETGGFTEFVPLRFIWQNTALYQTGWSRRRRRALRDLRMYAVSPPHAARLDRQPADLVGEARPPSWRSSSLRAGCNDFGGTLMEESISREAGADAGEYTSAEEIGALMRGMGRVPVQRTTLYGAGSARRTVAAHADRRCWLVAWEQRASCGASARCLIPRRLTIIVNTGDDETFFGLHVSPDLDTVLYTLGRTGRSGSRLGPRGRHLRVPRTPSARLGEPTWFRLGDRDLATHLFRTERLRAGWPLSRVTASAGASATASAPRCCR